MEKILNVKLADCIDCEDPLEYLEKTVQDNSIAEIKLVLARDEDGLHLVSVEPLKKSHKTLY